MADDNADSGEKTEQPTERRLEEAHKKGDVPKSQEVVLFTGLLMMFVMIAVAGLSSPSRLAQSLKVMIERAGSTSMDAPSAIVFASNVGSMLLAVVALPLVGLVVGSVLGNIIQHRFVWSLTPMTPKLERISPLAGAKRLFSSQSVVQLVKSIGKLGLISLVLVMVLLPYVSDMPWLLGMPVTVVPDLLYQVGLKVMAGVVVIFAFIAGLDWLFQRHKWTERQRMSLKEIRDELKSSDGDPELKARLRQIRAERGRKRMMQNVPDATVVITNPTHIAIALRYEAGMTAPVCVAKGIDSLALRIREVAREARVPLVENKPLARALHETVEINEEIPLEHYTSVATVIGYVMSRRAAGH